MCQLRMARMNKAQRLAKRLLRENKRGRTWRTIAREDFNDQVNYATLNRITREKGAWIPKDEQLQIILGLRQPCAPHIKWELLPGEKEIKNRIACMAKDMRTSFKEFLS